MRINEVIYFSHELDMLEVHLEEHKDYVQKFFIKESPVFFTGAKKPLYFTENKDRYSKYNIELIIIPPEEYDLSIPTSFPKEEFKKWFDVRRKNRQKSRLYEWDKIRKDCDYVLSMDCDEIIDSRRFPLLINLMNCKRFEFIGLKLKQSQFWVNTAKGKNIKVYRAFRSDKQYGDKIKGRPRTITPNIGWHFTNCYFPEDIRKKAIGITTHYGIYGVDNVMSAKEIGKLLEKRINPFICRWSQGKLVESTTNFNVKRVKSTENREWAPKVIREKPELFPWYYVRPENGGSV